MGELRLGHQPVEPGVRLAVVPRRPRRADELGYDHVWTWDHVQAIFGDPDQPIFEGYTALAALAQATKRVRLGLFVGANTFRNPGLVAKSIATIDHISDGRAIMGLGGAWFGHEHQSFGIDFGSGFGQRLDWLAEAVPDRPRPARRPARSRTPGRATRSTTCRILPRPVQAHVPVMIGGGGERKTLRIVARYADMWNVFGTPGDGRPQGRDPAPALRGGRPRPGGDRADARLQGHDPLDRGRGRAGPAGRPRAQPDAAVAGRGRRVVLDGDAGADRRDDDRLPQGRLRHVHRRAAGALRRTRRSSA